MLRAQKLDVEPSEISDHTIFTHVSPDSLYKSVGVLAFSPLFDNNAHRTTGRNLLQDALVRYTENPDADRPLSFFVNDALCENPDIADTYDGDLVVQGNIDVALVRFNGDHTVDAHGLSNDDGTITITTLSIATAYFGRHRSRSNINDQWSEPSRSTPELESNLEYDRRLPQDSVRSVVLYSQGVPDTKRRIDIAALPDSTFGSAYTDRLAIKVDI